MYKYKLSNLIDNFISDNQKNINSLALKYSLNSKTIEIQIRLHLPFYDIEQLKNDNNNIVYEICVKLDKYLKFYHYFNMKLDLKYNFLFDSKIKGKNDIYIETKNNEKIKIYFKKINSVVTDKIFHQKLHYIKKFRKDTFESFGFFLKENDKYPICYASLSICDRNYLINALKKVNILDDNFKNTILILTRAFSIENAPKNLMSKFFDCIYNYYTSNNDVSIILTALNPVLGFQGSIFKGSSYFQFASSPMIYYYDKNGVYLNRRTSINKLSYKNKIEIPPIIWLARGTNKKIQKNIENNKLIYTITNDEYGTG